MCALPRLVATMSDDSYQVIKDRSATTLLGPQATPQQNLNAQMTSFLFHCEGRMVALEKEYPENTAAIFSQGVKVGCPARVECDPHQTSLLCRTCGRRTRV